MSEESTSKSSKVWLYVVSLLVGLPLLYVLSVGPAVVLDKRGLIPSGLLHFFFDPLAQVVNAVGVGNMFFDYLAFWMAATNTPMP